jgi:hypothetical protein
MTIVTGEIKPIRMGTAAIETEERNQGSMPERTAVLSASISKGRTGMATTLTVT